MRKRISGSSQSRKKWFNILFRMPQHSRHEMFGTLQGSCLLCSMACGQHRFDSKVGMKTPMLGFSQVCSRAASLCTKCAALCIALPGTALTLLTTTHCSYLGRATTSVKRVKKNSRIMLDPLSPLDKRALYMSSSHQPHRDTEC